MTTKTAEQIREAELIAEAYTYGEKAGLRMELIAEAQEADRQWRKAWARGDEAQQEALEEYSELIWNIIHDELS